MTLVSFLSGGYSFHWFSDAISLFYLGINLVGANLVKKAILSMIH